MTLSDYVPHGMILALGTIAGWVYRDHAHRDDARFAEVATSLDKVSSKIDEAFKTQASNHSEILKILLERST
jgi:hypothetical protein